MPLMGVCTIVNRNTSQTIFTGVTTQVQCYDRGAAQRPRPIILNWRPLSNPAPPTASIIERSRIGKGDRRG